jgi:hypothetical protein
MVVFPEAPFGRWWQTEVGPLFGVDVLPMILGKIFHIYVELTPAVELGVGNMIVLMTLHMVGMPGEWAVQNEKSTGVHQVEL